MGWMTGGGWFSKWLIILLLLPLIVYCNIVDKVKSAIADHKNFRAARKKLQ